MYLDKLKLNEKKAFLCFAVSVAKADSDFDENEIKMIESYCREMTITFDREKIEKSSVEGMIDYICVESNMMVKKIIIFELIGLAKVDNKFSDEEVMFIKKMAKEFRVAESYVKECEILIDRYIALQRDIEKIVLA